VKIRLHAVMSVSFYIFR